MEDLSIEKFSLHRNFKLNFSSTFVDRKLSIVHFCGQDYLVHFCGPGFLSSFVYFISFSHDFVVVLHFFFFIFFSVTSGFFLCRFLPSSRSYEARFFSRITPFFLYFLHLVFFPFLVSSIHHFSSFSFLSFLFASSLPFLV